jgi:alanine dehydrogenase
MESADIVGDLESKLSRPVDGALELPARLTIDAARGQGFLRLMPVIAYDMGYAGYKAMNFHPEFGARYMIAVIALSNGELVALLDADWITAARTAVTAAIAVRHLARPGSERVAVIGSGTQARALLEATTKVLTPSRVLVHSPTAINRERFAAEMTEQLGVPVEAAGSLTQALRDADVVLSAFRAKGDPVLFDDAVGDGTLVCGISGVRSGHREIDMSLWKRSRVVVDDLIHVRESGDGQAAEVLGLVDERDVPELWQVLRDPSLGRQDENQRLLFKSVGTAEQDIALAAIVVERARELGLGEELGDFPGLRPIQSKLAAASEGR